MIVIRSCHVTLMSMTRTLSGSKKPGRRRPAAGQTMGTRLNTKNSRETDTTILMTSVVPSMPRKMTRSMSAPNSGAMTISTMTRANAAGHPHSSRNCQ